MSAKSRVLFNKRKARNRFSIRAKATSDLRLTVFRSNTNFYCQIINDQKGVTLLSVSSLDKNLKKEIKKNAGNKIAAEIVGLRYVEVSTSAEDFDLDVERIIEVVEAISPSLIFLASPNNPTGKAVKRIDLERICRSSKGLVVLDEAYWRFSQRSFVSLVESFENLLVLQTLSKVGFAGLRVGMLYGPKPWVDLIDKIRMPYNINSLSQAGAMFVLSQEKLIFKNIQEVIREREWMLDQLSSIKNLKVWPSEANFVLVRPTRKSGTEVFSKLKSKGFLVKDLSGSHPELIDCLRITVGNHKENTGFIEALTALCG